MAQHFMMTHTLARDILAHDPDRPEHYDYLEAHPHRPSGISVLELRRAAREFLRVHESPEPVVEASAPETKAEGDRCGGSRRVPQDRGAETQARPVGHAPARNAGVAGACSCGGRRARMDHRHRQCRQRGPRPSASVIECAHEWVPTPSRIPYCSRCGKVAHASPSQREAWDGCPRKWKYRRLKTPEDKPNKFAEFGTRAHKIREDYLREGTWTPAIAASPEGQCVAAGFGHWVGPGEADAVEVALDNVPMLGVLWTFRIDSITRFRRRTFARVEDLKTIGDLANRKSVGDLLTDVQRILYSAWAGLVLLVPEAESEWSYCQRKPPKCETVALTEPTAHSIQRLEAEVDTTINMLEANVRPIEEQDRNLLHCGAFGGCGFRSRCLRDVRGVDVLAASLYTPNVSGRRAREDQTMTTPTLEDHLRAKAAANSNTTPAVGLPPMPGSDALPPVQPIAPPVLTLPPELEQWVLSCPPEHQATARAQAEAEVRRREEAANVAPVTATPTNPTVEVAVETKPVEVTVSTGTPKRGRGRPATPARVKMLEACAAGGLSADQAAEYLALIDGEEGAA